MEQRKMYWEIHGLSACSTKEQIVQAVLDLETDEGLNFLAQQTTEGCGRLHHGFGTYLRNEFGLWNDEHPLTKVWFDAAKVNDKSQIIDGTDHHPAHPDAVSMEIIREVCRQAKKRVNKDA